MSLSMLGHIDSTLATEQVTIIKPSGAYVDGSFVDDGNAVASTHRATKQVISSEELRKINEGGKRYTDAARFYISDGSQHEINSILTDGAGKTYRIFDADCRPARNYCKLTGGAESV